MSEPDDRTGQQDDGVCGEAEDVQQCEFVHSGLFMPMGFLCHGSSIAGTPDVKKVVEPSQATAKPIMNYAPSSPLDAAAHMFTHAVKTA